MFISRIYYICSYDVVVKLEYILSTIGIVASTNRTNQAQLEYMLVIVSNSRVPIYKYIC